MYTIKGIISAERPCECCGNKNLEKNVVLERDGELLYVGTSCAAKLIHGSKSRKNQNTVDCFAKACSLATRWFDAGHSFEDVLVGLRSRTGLAIDTEGRTIRFWSRSTREVVASVSAPE